jgi:hypothetical protein
LLACLMAIAIAPGLALAEEGMSAPSEAGLGTASALCSLIYGPVKVVYATLGLVVGGVAWGLSAGDPDVRDAVITPAIRGDYVVTPAHLRGDRGLEFIGRNPEYRRSSDLTVESY